MITFVDNISRKRLANRNNLSPHKTYCEKRLCTIQQQLCNDAHSAAENASFDEICISKLLEIYLNRRRHATPRHATPRHATPRHATPDLASPASKIDTLIDAILNDDRRTYNTEEATSRPSRHLILV